MTVPLSSIEPLQFAEDVCREVGQMAAYGWQLTTGEELDRTKVSASGTLGTNALALARYAKAGPPVPGFTGGLREIERALVMVTSALHIPAFSLHQIEDLNGIVSVLGGGTVRMAIPLDHPINVVLAASWARLRLELNESVTPAQLALLASVSEDTVRADVRAGELPSTGKRPAVIPARAARLWLTARGLSGYETHVKVVPVGTKWAGLAYSPWHQEWGRVTKLYPTKERAANALARLGEEEPTQVSDGRSRVGKAEQAIGSCSNSQRWLRGIRM